MYALTSGLWLLSFVAISLSVGYYTMTLGRQLALPRPARFALGASLAPNLIGAWTLAFTLIAPQSNRWLLLLIPLAVAAAFLLFNIRAFLRQTAFKLARQLWQRKSLVKIVVLLGYAAIFGALLQAIRFQLGQAISGSDALQYLTEAKTLAENLNLADYSGFRGTSDGSLRGDFHGASWPALFAHALSANAIATGEIGFPQDLAVRLSVAMTFVAMLIGFFALAASVDRVWLLPLVAMVFFLSTKDLDYVLTSASRDAFRLIPLFTLIALLMSQFVRPTINRFKLSVGVLLIAVSWATVNGHTLSIMEVPIIVGAWLVACFVFKRGNLKTYFLTLTCIAAGAILGGAHYIVALLETGSIWGDNALAESVLVGTVYESSLRAVHDARLSFGPGFLRLIAHIVERNAVQILLATITLVVVLTMTSPNKRRYLSGDAFLSASLFKQQYFMAVVTLAIFLLIFVIGQLPFVNLTYSAAANFRYSFLLNSLASIVSAIGIVTLLKSPKIPRDASEVVDILVKTYGIISRTAIHIYKYITGLNWGSVSAVNLLIAAMGIAYLFGNFSTPRWFYTYTGRLENLPDINDAAKSVPADCKYISDSEALAYQIDTPVIKLYSRPTASLFQANSAGEIEQYMKTNSVCFLVISKSLYLNSSSRETPMGLFIDSPDSMIKSGFGRDVYEGHDLSFLKSVFVKTPVTRVSGLGAALELEMPIDLKRNDRLKVSYLLRTSHADTVGLASNQNEKGKQYEKHPGDGYWRWHTTEIIIEQDGKPTLLLGDIQHKFDPDLRASTTVSFEFAIVSATVNGSNSDVVWSAQKSDTNGDDAKHWKTIPDEGTSMEWTQLN
ncbi:MAG: hypothetical protein AAF468_14755 [Pseudomonadota bacterium]